VYKAICKLVKGGAILWLWR